MKAIVLLLCMTAISQAELIHAPITEGTLNSAGTIGSPKTATLEIRNNGDLVDSWVVPGITPDDSGTTYMLTENNATNFGVDWPTLEDLILNEPEQVSFRDLTVAPNNTPFRYYPLFNPGYEFSDLDAIELRIPAFISSPIGSVFSWKWELSGDGRVVPEPSTFWLVSCLIVLCVRLRKPFV